MTVHLNLATLSKVWELTSRLIRHSEQIEGLQTRFTINEFSLQVEGHQNSRTESFLKVRICKI